MTKKKLLKELERREQFWKKKVEEMQEKNNRSCEYMYDDFAIECKYIREMIERDF